MNTKQNKRETPTLLDVLDAWGSENEKRMLRKERKQLKHNKLNTP